MTYFALLLGTAVLSGWWTVKGLRRGAIVRCEWRDLGV
jgi:hypothetical protein